MGELINLNAASVNSFDFVVTPVSLTANTWQGVGNGLLIGEQGKGSSWLINLYFQYVDSGGLSQPYFQYCGAGIVGCIFWQADFLANEGVAIPMEAHNEADFTMRMRFGRGQSRQLELKPDRAISISSPGFFQAKGVRWQ